MKNKLDENKSLTDAIVELVGSFKVHKTKEKGDEEEED